MTNMITKEMVDPLVEKRKKLNEKLMKVDKALWAIQDLCDHAWVNDGHDSHKDHQVCTICGKRESW